eukprot:evm.model.scf_2589.2 EVM.evm.TU.scf_2589.2   scf_2589:10207-11508(+)
MGNLASHPGPEEPNGKAPVRIDTSSPYRVEGTYVGGAPYTGTCTITRLRGKTYRFRWFNAAITASGASQPSLYTGTGKLKRGVIAVDWGGGSPAVYAVLEDGRLRGNWANGLATENLTPERVEGIGGASGPDVSGCYAVKCANPRGTWPYTGTCRVTRQGGNVFRFRREISSGTAKAVPEVFVHTGTGTMTEAGIRMDWGACAPAMYEILKDGRLRGVWAGGRATDDLTPVFDEVEEARTAGGIAGAYRAEGRRPDGSTYRGSCEIGRQDEEGEFGLDWRWEGGSQTGVGRMEGGKLRVQWGDHEDAVYEILRDGRLQGRWGEGKGSESLTPTRLDCVADITGSYRVEGSKGGEGEYRGACNVSGMGAPGTERGFVFGWMVGKTAYTGVGTLRGDTISVEWGGDSPAVYSLQGDGSLVGSWDGGRCTERMVRQ